MKKITVYTQPMIEIVDVELEGTILTDSEYGGTIEGGFDDGDS